MSNDINDILKDWPTESEMAARCIVGSDGAEQLQLRVDLGLLQMHLDGRPDGEKPFGRQSLLDHLHDLVASSPEAKIDDDTWDEVDREIMQFYQRRRALLMLGAQAQSDGEVELAIGYYRRSIRDANHNLAVMDLIRHHSCCQEFIEGHERYRPFVIMHRTLAEAQIELLQKDPHEAVERLKSGVDQIETIYETVEAPEMAGQDPSIMQLRALERQVRKRHDILMTLQEQLEEAVSNERYERAAELRDKLRAKQAAKAYSA